MLTSPARRDAVSAYDAEGDLLATNDFYSVGGGFVVNGAMSTGRAATSEGDGASSSHPVDLNENFLYKAIRPKDAAGARRAGAQRPPQAEEAPKQQLAAPEPDTELAPKPLEKQETNLPDRKAAQSRGPVVPFVFWDAASLLALTRKHNMVRAAVTPCCDAPLTPDADDRADRV